MDQTVRCKGSECWKSVAHRQNLRNDSWVTSDKEWKGGSGNDEQRIGGDGGPLIVIQQGAVSKWQGAANFENSLMNGGTIETDYDVICEIGDAKIPALLHRHDRDMLVFTDSEWSGGIFTLGPSIVIVQFYYYDEGALPDIVERARKSDPADSFDFLALDSTMRLQVGADDGGAENYGFAEVSVVPGKMRCNTYRFDDGIVALLGQP